MSEVQSPLLEVARMIEDVGADTLRMCYSCGTCSASCPHNRVSDFRIREVVRLAQMGLEGYEGDQLWRCSTCKLCVDRCPRRVEIIDVVRSARTIMQDMGSVPAAQASALGSVAGLGNPWQGDPEARRSWAGDLPLPVYSEDMEVLVFQCCTLAYDPRGQKAGRALLRLLQAAGVRYGVLAQERCCGESVAKMGHQELFESLRDGNTEAIVASGAKRIITTSPHCHQAFTQDYPGLGEVEVVPVLSFLRELIEQGRLKPTEPVDLRVAYHDPCYLGRHVGEYEAPRAVLDAIPGLQRVEMAGHHADSICCGGGGGGMWAERPVQERLSLVRWKQADQVQASTMATACPYCTLMMEDGRTALEREDSHQVLDVVELLDRAVK